MNCYHIIVSIECNKMLFSVQNILVCVSMFLLVIKVTRIFRNGSDSMLNVKITKEELNYVAEFVTQATQEVKSVSMRSLHDVVYNLGRFIHMNNIHFHIPPELTKSLLSSLKMEYPGEVYEHKITVH